MLRLSIFIFFSLLLKVTNAQVSVDWVKRHGSYTTDRGTAVTVDKQRNLIAAGIFTDTLHINNQTFIGFDFLDSYVSKLDSSGNYLWVQLIQGPKDDQAERVVTLENGDVIVAGTFADSVQIGNLKTYAQANDDVWLTRLDGDDGSPQWLISAGSYYSYERVGGLAVNQDYIYWAINFGADIIIDDDTITAQGFNDALVAIYDHNGNYMEADALSGSGNDNITDIACNEFGQVFVGGKFNGIFYGDTTNGAFDLFYGMLFGSSVEWMKTFGGAGSETITALTRDPQNNIYLAGYFLDTLQLADSLLLPDDVWSDQVFVMRVNQNGNSDWYFVGFPDSGADYISDITIACNGDLLFTGLSTYFANQNPEMPPQNENNNTRCQFGDSYIARMNNQGELLWIKNTLGTNLNSGTSIATDSAGHIYVTGYFTDSLYLYNTAIDGNGGNDGYLFRYTDSANCLPDDTTLVLTNDLGENNFILYPNPSNGNSYLVSGNFFFQTTLKLNDATGRTLHQVAVNASSQIIPLQKIFGNISSGIYFVTIDRNNSRQILKWIVTP